MSILTQALTDIAGIIDPAVLGQSVTLDGDTVVAIVGQVTAEEMAARGYDGLNTEMTAVHLRGSDLDAVPVPQQNVVLNSVTWTVGDVRQAGDIVRLLLHRYTS